ncbi:hypothetical protein CMI47_01125 [Candidatus Pacearchaeota archaeon]|nr:hypothetical protein [Candidatus Pacearchaeota archaeon]|tara:strand:+ start:1411 stop:1860 length:450 start_codon:yes stop_codon:yes gene_type:complete
MKRLVEFLNERTPDLVLEEGPSNPGEALVFAVALLLTIPKGEEGGDRYARLSETAEGLWNEFESESPDPDEDQKIMEAGASLLAGMMVGTLLIQNDDGTIDEVPYNAAIAKRMRESGLHPLAFGELPEPLDVTTLLTTTGPFVGPVGEA